MAIVPSVWKPDRPRMAGGVAAGAGTGVVSDQWEVQQCALPRVGIVLLPEGWEPFAAYDGGLWLRRRVIEVSVRHIPGRVLSAHEMAARRRELVKRQRKEIG